MINRIIILILFISISLGTDAQVEQTLLWKISGNELSEPSYLFGTIHLLPKKKFQLSEKVENALSQSNILITEISLDIPLKKQVEIAKEMYLPENRTYQNYISAEEYELVYHFMLDSLNIRKGKIKRIIRIKPFFSSGLVLKEYYGKIKSIELELKKVAKQNDMNFGSLETIEEQLKLVNDMTIEQQFEDLHADLTSIPEFNKMVDCYIEENLICLKDLVFNENDSEDFINEFLYARNENWIPTIESYILKNASFIAVGAGHLLGEKGLIELLLEKGYSVTPVY